MALVVAGAFSSARSRSIADSVKHGPGGTTQLDAAEKQKASDAAVRRANLFFAAGGAALVLGALGLSVGHWRLGPAAVGLGPGPSASLALTW